LIDFVVVGNKLNAACLSGFPPNFPARKTLHYSNTPSLRAPGFEDEDDDEDENEAPSEARQKAAPL